jgi:hypothetical protein
MNRTQVAVLGLLAASWIGLVAILALAPAVYDAALADRGLDLPTARVALLVAISGLIAVLSIGVRRRWRWLFWVLAAAFVAGALRVPATLLELTGVIPTTGPAWLVVVQGALGLVQCGVGVAMLRGYRRGGPWSAF